MSVEKIYPGQGERVKQKIRESDLNKTLNNNLFNLRPEDLTAIVKQALQEAQEPLKDKKRQTEAKPRSSTPKYEWLSESDEQSDDSSKSTPGRNRTQTGPTRRGQAPRKGRDSDRSVSPLDRRHTKGDEPSFQEFAKLMGDNLVALRKIQDCPPRWGGPRMKTYKGDYRENFDDFADEIVCGCKKMGFKNDKEENVRYLRGFLEGEAAGFLANMPNKTQLTLKEVLKKLKERFKNSQTQSDFVYMLTTRRCNPKNETVRENSHNLMKLVARAYPDMSDDQRDQILKQKFLSSIKSEDFGKPVLNNKLAKASYQEIVVSVAKAEEFRRQKRGAGRNLMTSGSATPCKRDQ